VNERRILVADDDSFVRGVTQLQLRNLCKEMGLVAVIESASTGKEAIAMAKATEYHLAVLDNNMESRNNGVDAVLEIRGFRPELPMILYTSEVDDDKATAVRNAGAEIAMKGGYAELGDVVLADVARKYLEGRK